MNHLSPLTQSRDTAQLILDLTNTEAKREQVNDVQRTLFLHQLAGCVLALIASIEHHANLDELAAHSYPQRFLPQPEPAGPAQPDMPEPWGKHEFTDRLEQEAVTEDREIARLVRLMPLWFSLHHRAHFPEGAAPGSYNDEYAVSASSINHVLRWHPTILEALRDMEKELADDA